MHASEHTRLINRFIGLCMDMKKWPGPLADLGYEVRLIEQTLSADAAEDVKPDVVAVSDRLNHAILTECRGDGIDKDQDKRYSGISGSLMDCTTHDGKRVPHTFCYSDTDQNHERLKPHTKFPFITFGRKSIVGNGDFVMPELNRALCRPMPLDGMYEPASFHPFSIDDKDHLMVPHVLRGLVSCMTGKGSKRHDVSAPDNICHMLDVIHPFNDVMDSEHKRYLAERIRSIMTECMGMSPAIRDACSMEKDMSDPRNLKGLERACSKIIRRYENQKRITDSY